jgi:UDP-galactopyranose mutase
MDTLCFSHLRWDFVYQRPQHLLKRFSQTGRVFYIEEAFDTHASSYYEIHHDKEHPNLWIVHLYVSPGETMQKNAQLQTLLCLLLEAFHVSDFISWYNTPKALAYTKSHKPK